MDAIAWVLTVLLAVLYAVVGLVKVVQPRARLLGQPRLAWVADFPGWSVTAIGLLELAGAAGLVLPWATGIARILTPIAALGLVLLQGGAAATHLRRHEARTLPANVVLLLLAAALAAIRFAQL